MNKTFKHIFIVLASAAAMLSSCSRSEEAVVIPRRELAKIYAEMLVTDQWITSTPGVRLMADTSLVYPPILERYGYDIDDYVLTVDHYMNDPERFSRILRESGELIGKRLEKAELRLSEEQRIAALPKVETDFDPEEFFPYLFGEPYVHYYDSLTFEPDSLLQIYRLVHIERKDTLFDGIRVIVQVDSLAVEDSSSVAVPVRDSIVAETALPVDSARHNTLSLMKADRNVTEVK